MKLKRGHSLPDADHVVRYVPWTRLLRDEDDKVLGLLLQAFQLRDGESSLSVNWLEYLNSDKSTNLAECVKAFRRVYKCGTKSGYAVASVGNVKAVFVRKQRVVRIVYEPSPNNKAHSAIHAKINDDLALLDELGGEFYKEFHFNSKFP